MGCVYAYVILLTFLGPENLGRDFHVENDEDMAAAASPEALAAAGNVGHKDHHSSDDGHISEKGHADLSV